MEHTSWHITVEFGTGYSDRHNLQGGGLWWRFWTLEQDCWRSDISDYEIPGNVGRDAVGEGEGREYTIRPDTSNTSDTSDTLDMRRTRGVWHSQWMSRIRARQSICHYILCSCEMADITVEFIKERDAALLHSGPGLVNGKQNKIFTF